MTIKQFNKLSADWSLSTPFRHAILTAIKRGRNYAVTTTSGITKLDKRWCKENGFTIEIENDNVKIEI